MSGKPASRFAFVFYATQWRKDLWWPLQVCLHSLDTRGGAASQYDRYLVYPEEVTPEIQRFCDAHRLEIRREPRFTYRLAWPNKATMCRVPEHEVVCLLDLDILFLADPTPMFERTAETGRAFSRLDLLIPLNPWPKAPPAWARWLREDLGQRIWRGQYRRFGPAEFEEVPRAGGGTTPPYFNNGVNFIPGGRLRALGDAWRHIAETLLRDIALRRPYTFFFTHYFLDQISYALALHRCGIPWSVLESSYNFIPSPEAVGEDLRLLADTRIVMAHMVSPIRHWLEPSAAPEVPELLLPLFREIRQVVEEIPCG